MKNILFVCTGNTCRSCMAEGIMKKLLSESGDLGITFNVQSAGISAIDGDVASAGAIQALKEEWDIDVSSHVSKKLSHEMLENAFLILTMTRSHKNAVISYWPKFAPKVYTIKEYVNNKQKSAADEYDFSLDIPDPYGMPVHVYRKCAGEIKGALDKLIKMLRQDGENKNI